MERDPYLYPGANVLKNKLNLQDADKLEQAEGALSKSRYLEIRPGFPAGNFDYQHLKAIHRHLFQDLYEWAGQERSVNIAKESGPFAIIGFIAPEANKLFARLNSDNLLRGLDLDTFCTKAADYYADINALHPFREGNGRTLNAFMSQLAYQAGYALRWGKTTKEEYLDAARASHAGDNTKLTAQFQKITEPLQLAKPSRFEMLQARRKGFDLER
jgi:cell filamentation protein